MASKTEIRLATALLVVHGALLAWGAARHRFAWTEAGLLPAGILHWRTGSCEHFRVNPPLLRMFATLPVLAMDPVLPVAQSHHDPRVRSEWKLATVLVRENGERSLWMLTVARWACIPISLLGAWICYRWAGELFGARAGLLALALWCFSPEMIAHGQMISGDAAAAVFGLLTFYVMRQWLRRPQWNRALLLGVAIGLAISTKTTWLILFALAPLLWLARRAIDRTTNGEELSAFREVGMMFSSLLVALLLLNAWYGFQGSLQRLGDFTFLSRALTGEEPLTEHEPFVERNRFRGTWLAFIPVPLPAEFVTGVDLQKWDFERPRLSYLEGRWRDRGWWYYYLYALTMKMPMGNWVLLLSDDFCLGSRQCTPPHVYARNSC